MNKGWMVKEGKTDARFKYGLMIIDLNPKGETSSEVW
jgi:hypothetical protein